MKAIAVYYLVGINVLTFIMYGIDKWKAQKGQWRIPEARLLGLAALGGSIGAWIGMQTWHHKTLHKKFRYGIPLILALQIVLLLLASCKAHRKVEIPASVQYTPLVPEHSPNVFLVMYDAGVGKEPLQKAIKEYGCEVVYDYNIIHGMALRKPEKKTLEETMQHFKGVKGVVMVEYDHITRLTDPVRPRLELR